MMTQQIWADFRAELFGYIRARVSDASTAEDILQDVFVKIHLHHGSLRSADKLPNWLYRITHNAVVDHYRTTAARKASTNWPDEPADDHPAGEPDFSRCVQVFLRELPTPYREALEQTSFGALSQKAFAEQAGLSYSGAKSRIQRARKQLKDLFVACCNPQADAYGNIIDSDEERCRCQ